MNRLRGQQVTRLAVGYARETTPELIVHYIHLGRAPNKDAAKTCRAAIKRVLSVRGVTVPRALACGNQLCDFCAGR